MKWDLLPSAVAKFRSGLIFVLAFSLVASQANAVCVSAFEVTIQVTLLDTKSGNALKDYSEVVGGWCRSASSRQQVCPGTTSLPQDAAQQDVRTSLAGGPCG